MSDPSPTVFVVDDDPSFLSGLTRLLRASGYRADAADLEINERSVKRHRASLLRKLEVESVAEPAQLAFEAGKQGTIPD